MHRRLFLQAAVGLVVPPRRVWLIGDSNAWLLKPWLGKLATAEGFIYDGSPIGGSSVISWSRDYQLEISKLRQFKPDYLIVGLGSNDAYMGERVIRNEPPFLARLLRRLRGKIIWLGPPDLPRARRGLDAFAKMIRKAGLPYVDSREVTIPMWDDQLHPTELGRKIWAAWAWPRLAALM